MDSFQTNIYNELKRYESLLLNLQMGVLVENEGRVIENLNYEFCRLFGIPSPEIILGMDCEEAASGASKLFLDEQSFIEGINSALNNKEIILNEILQLKDGRTFERDFIPVFSENKFIGNMWVYRDVTERVSLENKLINNEKKYRFLYQNAPIAYQSLDVDGKIIDVNPKWCQITGYNFQEVKGKYFSDFLSKESIESFKSNFERIVNEGKTIRYVLHFLSKEKNELILEYEGCSTTDENMKFLFSNCILNDITEQLAIEKRLIKQKEDLKFAEKIAGVGSYETDLETGVWRGSENFYEMFGFDRTGEYTMQDFESILHPEDHKRVMENFYRSIREMRDFNEEYRVIHRISKEFIYVRSKSKIVYDVSGKALKIIGTKLNITDEIIKKQKTEEKVLHESLRADIWKAATIINDENELIQELLNKVGPAIGAENVSFMPYSFKLNKIIVEKIWRDDGEKIGIGDTIPQWIFKPFIGREYIYFSFDKLPDFVKVVLIPFQKKYGTKTTLVIPYGENLNPEGFLSCQTYSYYKEYTSEEINLIKEVSNIIYLRSKQIKAVKKIRENESKLKELNSTKDKLFSIIGHDLRAPFNAILGVSELLIDEVEKNNLFDLKEPINLIYQSASSSFNLLNNLLNWARVQTGKLEFSPTDVPLNEVILNVSSLLKISFREKDIKFTIALDEKIHVYVDSYMLETIFRNLLTNSVKFTKKGGMVKIQVEKSDKFAEISIIDNGIGMSKELIEQILSDDSNYSSVGTNNEKGFGLGLKLCKDFIQKNNGEFSIKSEEGKGSIFRFTLPLAV